MKSLVCLAVLSLATYGQDLERTEVIERTLAFENPDDTPRLLVDNISGSITVVGHDGTDVKLVATRKTRAESESKFLEAAEEVKLDIDARRDRIEVVVDTPWRNRWDGWGHRGYDFYGYRVSFDFELRVPRNVALYLRTVEKGDIRVERVDGEFRVKNVNGDVSLVGMGGHGHASTVNGSLDLTFRTSPTENCSFKTVNGKVDVTFPAGLSADLVLKTFNGKAYTDFDFAPAPPSGMKRTSKYGRAMLKIGNEYVVRVRDGGPQLAFDTLNGNIEIRKGEE